MGPESYNKKDIHLFLRSLQIETSFINRLKIRFRGLICPFDLILSEIKPGAKVFDIGCGSGLLCLLAAQFTKAASFTGIEIDPLLIDNAQKLFEKYAPHTKYHFELYNGSEFPAATSATDTWLLIDVIHHIPKENIKTFLEKVAKAMPAGARLILKDIDASSPLLVFNKLHDIIFAGEVGNEISSDTAVKMLRDSGLSIQMQKTKLELVYPHYMIVAVK